MKRLALVSVAVAALLLSGCEKKETQTSSAPAAQEAVKAEAPKAEAPKTEAKPAAEAPKPAQTEAKPAEAEANASQAEEQIAQTMKEVGETGQKKINEAIDKAKEAAKAAAAAAVGASAPAASAPAEASAGDKGKELYAKCASCHGQKGEMKALGKSAVIAGMAKDELVKKIKGYKAGTLNQYGMGALMKGQVASLSDADIEALADYISNLK